MLTGDADWHLLDSSNWVKGKARHLGLLERTGNVSFLLKTDRNNFFLILLFETLWFQSLYLGLGAFFFFLNTWDFWCCGQPFSFPEDSKPQFCNDLEMVSCRGLTFQSVYIAERLERVWVPMEPSAHQTQLLGVAFIHLTMSVHHWCHLETPEGFSWGTGRLELVSYWWTGLGQWTNRGPGPQEWNTAFELLCCRTGRDMPSSWSSLAALGACCHILLSHLLTLLSSVISRAPETNVPLGDMSSLPWGQLFSAPAWLDSSLKFHVFLPPSWLKCWGFF